MLALLITLTMLGEPREAGKALNVEIRYNTVDHQWRGRASCYTKDNKDGGYTPHPIKCGPAPAKEACQAELDKQAANGCLKP